MRFSPAVESAREGERNRAENPDWFATSQIVRIELFSLAGFVIRQRLVSQLA
jgi:hypothetical protein